MSRLGNACVIFARRGTAVGTGAKKFNRETGDYDEDESLENTDMQFSCPRCSVKLDPELLGF
jgi:hypothetical protein